jgi:thiol-disulfide isomerase/thioredoxin
MNRRVLLLVGAGLAAAVAGLLAAGLFTTPAPMTASTATPAMPASVEASPAQQLYSAQLNDADGQPINFEQFAGHTTVVNFWATWCAPCVEEMPEFDHVAQDVAGKGIKFVGIAIDSPSNMREFRQKVQVSYPLASAGFGGAELAKAMGNTTGGLPFTVLLSPKGEIVQRKLGRLSETELRSWLKQ